MFFSDEEPTLETLDFTIRVVHQPFDLYLNTSYAAHYVYFTKYKKGWYMESKCKVNKKNNKVNVSLSTYRGNVYTWNPFLIFSI